MEEDSEATLMEAIERKIKIKQYSDARTLLLMTIQKFPRTRYLSEMLIALEVLCATERKLSSNELDWYKVLQLLPFDDSASIKARYDYIVKKLEPARDCVSCANIALEFAKDAQDILLDPVKRSAFDMRKYSGVKSESTAKTNTTADHSWTSLTNASSGVHEMTNKEQSVEKTKCRGSATKDGTWMNSDIFSGKDMMPQGGLNGKTSSSSIVNRAESDFFSQIGECEAAASGHPNKKQKMISTMDETLFSKSECNDDRTVVSPIKKMTSCYSDTTSEFYDFNNDRTISKFEVGQIWVTADLEGMPRRYARIAKIIKEKMQLDVYWFTALPQSSTGKSWCDAGLPVACGSFVEEESKLSLIDASICSAQVPTVVCDKKLEVYPSTGEVWAVYRDWDIDWCSYPMMRKKSFFLIVEVLSECIKDSAVKVIFLAKVDGFRNVFQRYQKCGEELAFGIPFDNLLTFSHKIPSFRFQGGEAYGIMQGMLELDHSAIPDNLSPDFICLSSVSLSPASPEEINGIPYPNHAELSRSLVSRTEFGVPKSGPLFDNKLTVKNFKVDQVWAIFDDFDKMPRSYVKVISVVAPTDVCVSYLEPHPVLDEEIQWVEENLPVVCGIFRVCKETTILEICRFSHLVKCDKSSKKSFYRIFPRRGEIWAMYDNWHISWKNSNLSRYWPRMVEILSDYSEGNGVNICSLVAVSGRLSFFQRQLHEKFQLTRSVPRAEMLCFSHQVPAFTVVDIKDPALPKSCWHLEPSAIPLKMFE